MHAWKSIGLWLIGGALTFVGTGLTLTWLERQFAPGVGWIWLTLTIAIGGVAITLRQGLRGRQAVCTLGPHLHPLQVSGLSLQALGALLFHYAQHPAFQTTLPLLTAPWVPLACVLGGLLILGLVSVTGDCRDAALRERV